MPTKPKPATTEPPAKLETLLLERVRVLEKIHKALHMTAVVMLDEAEKLSAEIVALAEEAARPKIVSITKPRRQQESASAPPAA